MLVRPRNLQETVNAVNRALSQVGIPADAYEKPTALYSIAADWEALLVPDRGSAAFKRNVEDIINNLSTGDSNSIIRKIIDYAQNYTQERPRPLSISNINCSSPSNTYELKIILGALGELYQEARPNSFVIQHADFDITFQISSIADSDSSIRLSFKCPAASKNFFSGLQQQDHALQAGRFFANKIRALVNDSNLVDHQGDSVDLGCYTFQVADQAAAAAAFLERNLPKLTTETPLVIENNLESVIRFLPSGRVTNLDHEDGYEINTDFLSYRLKMNAQGNIELSARLHLKQLTRDAEAWFSSSATAKEVIAILLATGVAHTLPGLLILASELNIDSSKGNGYASLSRVICGVTSGLRESDRAKLLELKDFFQGKLEDYLRHFRDMSSSTATHLVIDLLIGALSKSSLNQSLPMFRGPQNEECKNVDSCAYAEGYFIFSVMRRLYTIDPYFLYKDFGEPTALTRVPIVINGTLIPRGTLCQVHKDRDTIAWVKPIRLTLFSLPLDGEGAEIFRHHLHIYNRGSWSDDDVRAVYLALYA